MSVKIQIHEQLLSGEGPVSVYIERLDATFDLMPRRRSAETEARKGFDSSASLLDLKVELLRNEVKGWSGLKSYPSNVDVPYSTAALDALLEVPEIVMALDAEVRNLSRHVQEVEEKN